MVIGLILVAKSLGFFQVLEWKTLDRFLQLRPAESRDKRVIIVGIDEADIQQEETYPIPDTTLAALLETLASAGPRAIGVDIFRDLPVEPGHDALQATFDAFPMIFGIEKITGKFVLPPPALPPERVGFVDLPLDKDGFVRRAYLGALPPIDHPEADQYRFSLALKLAEAYLKEEGQILENGRQNPQNMRFGATEFRQFQANTGGYVGTKPDGVQVLINIRSGRSPFLRISMRDVLEGRVNLEVIRNRVVIVGITALSAKDLVNSAAVNTDNPGLFYGVEMHAHVTSQLLSAVLDNRPMLVSWSNGWDYVWITFWSGLGIVLGRSMRRPTRYMAAVGLAGLGLIGMSFGSLWLWGWWIPIMPTLLGLSLNGWVLPGFYLYDQTLKSRIDERQRVIEHTYDAIHNGPLQTLALLLREQQTLEPQVATQLTNLNQELRAIYRRLQQESISQVDQLQLGNRRVVSLHNPLHEVLHEVYVETLKRDFPGFQSLKLRVVKFEPLQVDRLSTDDKRSLCRFLEEALCNVGKHAIEARRLTVLCLTKGTENLIRIEDNGKGNAIPSSDKNAGRGTQQAQVLAQRLQGEFSQAFHITGAYSELRWPSKPANSWRLW